MYTSEKNCQIVIALLKAHGIKRVVASPGGTNIALVVSMQYDPWFEMYSAVDERHAAYLAVGMAEETNEPVVLSCTGATASRNYLPALTEAFYRKLPVLAITSSQVFTHMGQYLPQMIDRTQIQHDVANLSVWCPMVKDRDTFRYCEIQVNRAILELKHRGGGPAHINLETEYSKDFSLDVLPNVSKIERYDAFEDIPKIEPDMKVAVWIGAHKPFTRDENSALECFVRTHNAVVLTSKQSQYKGFGGVESSLLVSQPIKNSQEYSQLMPDVIIHLGEVTADYANQGFLTRLAPVWRVSPDGEIRDLLGRCEKVFEMPEEVFFSAQISEGDSEQRNKYLLDWERASAKMVDKIPDMPFSSCWIAQTFAPMIPSGSVIHLGILNPIRYFNCCAKLQNVDGYCNSGGFGIDGNMSSLIGGSLTMPTKLHFGMFGDLSCFYDLNSLGNRHIGNNLRILIVNNGEGSEFRLPWNQATNFKYDTSKFVGAGRHFGNKSRNLLRDYSEDLGFIYLSASSKEEFVTKLPHFVAAKRDSPVLFECFVDPEDDLKSNRLIGSLIPVAEHPGAKPNGITPRNMAKRLLRKCLPKYAKEKIRALARSI